MSPDESRRRCVVCRCVPLGRSVGSSVTGAEEEQGMDQGGWEGGDGRGGILGLVYKGDD